MTKPSNDDDVSKEQIERYERIVSAAENQIDKIGKRYDEHARLLKIVLSTAIGVASLLFLLVQGIAIYFGHDRFKAMEDHVMTFETDCLSSLSNRIQDEITPNKIQEIAKDQITLVLSRQDESWLQIAELETIIGDSKAISHPKEASMQYEKALKIYCSKSNWTEITNLIGRLTAVGRVLRGQSNNTANLDTFKPTYEIYRQVATNMPAAYKPAVACFLDDYFKAVHIPGRRNEAENISKEILSIWSNKEIRAYWIRQPVNMLIVAIGDSYRRVGDLYIDYGDNNAFKTAMSIFTEMLTWAQDESDQAFAAYALQRRALAKLRLNDREAAKADCQQALQIYEDYQDDKNQKENISKCKALWSEIQAEK